MSNTVSVKLAASPMLPGERSYFDNDRRTMLIQNESL